LCGRCRGRLQLLPFWEAALNFVLSLRILRLDNETTQDLSIGLNRSTFIIHVMKRYVMKLGVNTNTSLNTAQKGNNLQSFNHLSFKVMGLLLIADHEVGMKQQV
jgi:hypothetical protein